MPLIHGGDWAGYKAQYGGMPLDFSANVSPLGLPDGVRRAMAQSLENAHLYPDPLCRALRAGLAEHLGQPAEQILCGAGAADLIFRLVLAVRPKTALVTAPTFAEYEQALATAGCSVAFHDLREEEEFRLTDAILPRITPETDLLFLCTPNNPTGWAIPRELLLRIARRCRETGTVLALDECFCSLLDEPEAFTMTGFLEEFPNLIILKAFTKLYAMAGLRLGYCLCREEGLLEKMAACAQPWSVSNVAQAAGIAALQERAYREKTKTLIHSQREFLRRELTALGVQVIGSQANYLFIRTDLPCLGQRLKERGILLRSCANYRGLDERYYRLAVRLPEENACLLQEMRGLVAAGKGTP